MGGVTDPTPAATDPAERAAAETAALAASRRLTRLGWACLLLAALLVPLTVVADVPTALRTFAIGLLVLAAARLATPGRGVIARARWWDVTALVLLAVGIGYLSFGPDLVPLG